jgi:molybdate transport system substrate-binding protein
MLRRRHLLFAAVGSPSLSSAAEASLTFAAASDLRYALDNALVAFRAAHRGTRLDVIYGASGKLATQIRHGAPFDVYLSADLAFAQALHAEGHAAAAPQVYAVGRLTAWSTDAALGRLPLDALVRDARVTRFAIANPEHAPYGRRAIEALRHLGVEAIARPKLVLGDNVAQAAAFVDSGAAQAGLVAHALLLSPPLTGKGASTLIPETWHSRLEQALVITRRAAGNALAHAFVRHLEAPATRALLARHGFSMPGER